MHGLWLQALVDGRVLCVHGGLSPDLRTLDQVQSVIHISFREAGLHGPVLSPSHPVLMQAQRSVFLTWLVCARHNCVSGCSLSLRHSCSGPARTGSRVYQGITFRDHLGDVSLADDA